MNVQEYISSGILESYVLGLASNDECREVQTMMAAHPEIKREVEAIEEALIVHAASQANHPPARLREKILAEIGGARIVSIDSVTTRTSSFFRYATAAAVLLFLISGAVNYILYEKLVSTKQRLADMSKEKEMLATDFQTQKANYQAQLNAVNSPDSKPVMLKGLALSPSSKAMVFWNEQTHEVFININELPAPPAGKQYQLWALANGQPVDAGMIDMDTTGMHKMKDINDAQAFAVTLEQSGGSPTPTMTAMYLMGNI